MNWTLLAVVALVVGPLLIWRSRRTSPPVFDAEQMSESALWGYFLLLVGAWGVLSIWANPSDLFFLVMMAAAVLALIAKLLGYRSKGNEKPLPAWAAFGFSNALVLALIGVGKTFLVEPMQIPSSSMRPGLVVGDFILINKFAYGVRIPFLNVPIVPNGKPQRGDVVVFRYPMDTKLNYIKRVIGVPGDKIEYRNKQLTVNGQKIDSVPVGEYRYNDRADETIQTVRMQESLGGKTYNTLNQPGAPTLLPPGVVDFPQRENCQHDETGFTCTVPDGRYLMLGDNRDNSNDGRYWGFVPDDHLAGKAFFIWMNIGEPSRIGTRIQ
ncbi:signal peptidase I [Chitinimonas koreensis]|uniref:signal peptidase I n=1 Tax=Chitinimonas koreensis TaxID=356302 RepID=UPI00040803EB|nr:signal peptidase I [Chitinimonas koreensis]QNM95578.1 signal peptidase I [Chitinimonas koreensis]